jgi:hypothetical protein
MLLQKKKAKKAISKVAGERKERERDLRECAGGGVTMKQQKLSRQHD